MKAWMTLLAVFSAGSVLRAQDCCSKHAESTLSCCHKASQAVRESESGAMDRPYDSCDLTGSTGDICICPCNAPQSVTVYDDTCEWNVRNDTIWVEAWWFELAKDAGLEVTEIEIGPDNFKVTAKPTLVPREAKSYSKRMEKREIVLPARCSCNRMMLASLADVIRWETNIMNAWSTDEGRHEEIKDQIDKKLRAIAEIESRMQRSLSWNTARLIEGGMDRGGKTREDIRRAIAEDLAYIKERLEFFCRNVKRMKELGYEISFGGEEWLRRFCPELKLGAALPRPDGGDSPNTVSKDSLEPLVSHGAVFAISHDAVPVHRDARTIEVLSASPAFDDSTDVVQVVRSDEAAAGLAIANEPDKPLASFPVEALAGGLAGLLVAGGTDGDSNAPIHYVTFDAKPSAQTAAGSVQSIASSDGTPGTLQSFAGRTAPMAVNVDPNLPPDATIAVGSRAAEGAEPTVAGTLLTEMIVQQRNGAGDIVAQTYFGRIEGKGLGSLAAEQAIVGVIDPATAKFDPATIRTLADVMTAPDGVPTTGTFRARIGLNPRAVKPGQEFDADAFPPDAQSVANAINSTAATVNAIGVTNLYIRGQLVDSKIWAEGPARGTGVAGDEPQVPVKATLEFRKGADAVEAVNAEHAKVRRATDDAVAKMPEAVQKKLRANADRSLLYATQLVSP